MDTSNQDLDNQWLFASPPSQTAKKAEAAISNFDDAIKDLIADPKAVADLTPEARDQLSAILPRTEIGNTYPTLNLLIELHQALPEGLFYKQQKQELAQKIEDMIGPTRSNFIKTLQFQDLGETTDTSSVSEIQEYVSLFFIIGAPEEKLPILTLYTDMNDPIKKAAIAGMIKAKINKDIELEYARMQESTETGYSLTKWCEYLNIGMIVAPAEIPNLADTKTIQKFIIDARAWVKEDPEKRSFMLHENKIPACLYPTQEAPTEAPTLQAGQS